jgi:Polyketide cyclase / dehydrase and lipid transport
VALAASLPLGISASAGTPGEVVAQRVAALRADGWAVEGTRHGVQVLSRAVPGSPVREVRALFVSPAPPDRLVGVVSDYADYAAFMPYVVRSEVLPSPDGVTRVFQQLDFGPPIHDRAYTIRLTPFRSPHDGSRGVTWTLETAPEFQRDNGGVRPPVNDGGWTFTPLGDGSSTLLEYLIRSDPGGWIPRWAANMAMRHSVPTVVTVVSQRAAAGD